LVRQTFKNFRKYRVVESDDSSTSVTLAENVGTTIQRGLDATRPTKFTESDIQRANEIVQRIADGLIIIPTNNLNTVNNLVSWYNNGQITAAEFINAFNEMKIKGVITETEGPATTQAEESGSSQGKEDAPVIVIGDVVIDDVEDRPRTLDELAALPVKTENTINRVIAGLFMGGIALAFMGGLKKK